MTPDNTNAGIGHNKPPRPDVASEKTLLAYVQSEYEPAITEFNDLMRREREMPTEVKDDAASGRITDYVAALTKSAKTFEAARTNEGAPYLAGQRTVNNFFKRFTDDIDKIKKRVDIANQKYLTWKKDEERRVARERAEREREEAAEALRKAAEAEAAAKEATRKAEAETARIAKEAADKLAAQAKELEAAKAETTADKATIKELETKLETTKKETAERVDEQTRETRATARGARREARRALDGAVQQDQVAAKVERMAENATDSALSRTRGMSGMAAVAKEWVGRVDHRPGAGRATIDLEALRPYLAMDAIEAAVQAAVRAGARSIKGALITEEVKTTYR